MTCPECSKADLRPEHGTEERPEGTYPAVVWLCPNCRAVFDEQELMTKKEKK